MESSLVDWLARTGSSAFAYSVWGFILVNGAAVAAFVITRDRTLVNRWTGRVLAANLVLAGTGIGIPAMTAIARLAITVVSPSTLLVSPMSNKTREEAPNAPTFEAEARR